MEALKNIKLFWKILLHKIFNINISKVQSFDNKSNCENDSARDVARSWQKEMMRQAFFVKALSPQLSSTMSNGKKCDKGLHIDEDNCTHIPKSPCSEGDCTDLVKKPSRVFLCHCKPLYCKDNECDCDIRQEEKTQKQCRFVSVKVETATVACNTCDNSVCISRLTNENNAQKAEMVKLINENASLKCELKKAYDESNRKEIYCPKLSSTSDKSYTMLCTPFKESVPTDDPSKVARDAESEMIITLQNCNAKNEVSPLSLSSYITSFLI